MEAMMSDQYAIPMYSRASDIKTLVLGGGCEGAWLLGHLYKDETPDTTWFILGTAIHETIETGIVNDLTLDEMLGDVELNLLLAVGNARNGILESRARNAKRSKATMKDDAQRIINKWWRTVHPKGDARNPIFDLYDWPPKTEYEIRVVEGADAIQLYTTVDAIFEGGPFGESTMIVDWKTGSTASAPHSQLHTYYFGGRSEGWIDDSCTKLVGRFWHADFCKDEPVFDYYGDDIVSTWIQRTYDAKKAMLDRGPVFSPDWICNYCPVRQFCPLKGDAASGYFGNRLGSIRVIYKPETEGEQ